ncbi:helix-turn-helix domain-containing protein [Paenibacillus allorhizosphaerae]|uniref:HTH-type transcriptional activator RhaR n=1 Tax=Paenibacillus allorhizosphaerae TaxID=2849866 RepID=A0ABN7TKM9_9BACL|nr:AraC family transcriptional regulator [Paenibacillus allorhizosphaerae]CAG7644278.1 HTH-type transcriptional activator RhaR [Paenibacillus allorhizosphaerae]
MGSLELSGGLALQYSDTQEYKMDSRYGVVIANEPYGAFGFVMKGSVKVTLEAESRGRTGKAAYGEVFYVPPHCRCTMQSSDKQTCHVMMIRFYFSGREPSESSSLEMSALLGRTDELRLHRFRMPRVRSWAQDLLSNRSGEDPSFYYLVHSYLYVIAAEFMAHLTKSKDKDVDLTDYVLQIKQHMLEHSDAPMDIEEIARLSGASPARFYQVFKQHTGLSPLQFITMAKLNESLRLLASSTLSVTEAAQAVGYPDPLYFSRLFKKHMGLTPTDYAVLAKKRVANLCPVFRGDLAVLGITPVLELPREWYDAPDKDKFVKQIEYCRPELIFTAPVPDELYATLSQLCPVVMITWKGYPWKARLREIGGVLHMPTVVERWLSYFEMKLDYARYHIRRHLDSNPYLVVSVFEPFYRVYGTQRIKMSDLFYGELHIMPPVSAQQISFLDTPSFEEVAELDCDGILLLVPASITDDACIKLEEEWLRLKRHRPRKHCIIIRHEEPLLYNASFYEGLIDQFVNTLLIYGN